MKRIKNEIKWLRCIYTPDCHCEGCNGHLCSPWQSVQQAVISNLSKLDRFPRRSLRSLLGMTVAVLLISSAASAESLFRLNASEAVYQVQPKSLFSTVRAKTIGDMITVVVNENTTLSNDSELNVKSTSDLTDNFSTIIENMFSNPEKGRKFRLPDVDGYGGESETKNTASTSKTIKVADTITTQVIQVLPNGNLVIQGKKIAINAGEKTQIILSGIVDPRFITNTGTVESQYVANLQLAIVGNGTVSRHDNESIISRIFSNLF